MTKLTFAAIKPREQKLTRIEAASLETALASIGLVFGRTDHGVLRRDPETGIGLGYVVYEFGFFVPPYLTHYAACCGRLIAGNSLVYQFNGEGATVSLPDEFVLDVTWLPTQVDVEVAIFKGLVPRPRIAWNNEPPTWQWPAPPPPDIAERMRQHVRATP